jgi:predicted nuclease of restriction endonuclease-like RecB superfamily
VYGTPAPGFANSINAYSRTKKGRREDLGEVFFRSSWEANYARYLNLLIQNKQIKKWEFEPDTFIFEKEIRGAKSYMPDFKITNNDESIEYHEVKGWMDPKSKSKLKKFAKYYPSIKLVLIDSKEYRKLEKQYKTVLVNWE